jgi:hypothetical protein
MKVGEPAFMVPVPSHGFHGRLCMPQEEVDLERSAIVVELGDWKKGGGVKAVFFVIHGLEASVAQEAVNVFHAHADLLVDVPSLAQAAELPADCDVKIMYTDEMRNYLATVETAGFLREVPNGDIVSTRAWRIFAAYVSVGMKLLVWPSQVRGLIEADRSGDPVELMGVLAPTPSRKTDPSEGAATRVVAPGLAEDMKFDLGVSLWRPLSEPLALQGGAWLASMDVSPPLDALRLKVPWMSEVIDIIEERLWLLRSVGRVWTQLDPLLLHGPSGCGKSYFASMLAEHLGIGFAETSVAGSTDNRDMEGTARGWSNFRPSWPVTSIAHLETANPLLFVDEIDKVDSNLHGDPRRTLLTMLDPKTAKRYPDAGLGRPVDISGVSWLFAANEVQGLDTALRDRLRVVTVRPPEVEHLPAIVESVTADMAAGLGVGRERLPEVGELGLSRIVAEYRERRSIRNVAGMTRALITRIMVSREKMPAKPKA